MCAARAPWVSPDFQVQIPSCAKLNDDGVVWYCIIMTNCGSADPPVDIWRRYSDFERLDAGLGDVKDKLSPGLSLPKKSFVIRSDSVSLPLSRFFGLSKNYSANVAGICNLMSQADDARRLGLEDYLINILSSSTCRNSTALGDFLAIRSNEAHLPAEPENMVLLDLTTQSTYGSATPSSDQDSHPDPEWLKAFRLQDASIQIKGRHVLEGGKNIRAASAETRTSRLAGTLPLCPNLRAPRSELLDLLDEQRDMMDRQDNALDNISGSLTRQRDIVKLIQQELLAQNSLLEDIESQMDQADSKMNKIRALRLKLSEETDPLDRLLIRIELAIVKYQELTTIIPSVADTQRAAKVAIGGTLAGIGVWAAYASLAVNPVS
ncbi:hypothetical protein P7C70_g8697, partial [Phenoliferia sp. Uapishka_3]